MNRDICYIAIAGKKHLAVVSFEPSLAKFSVFRIGRPSLGDALTGRIEYRTRAADAFSLARQLHKVSGRFIAVEYNAPIEEVAAAAERILDSGNHRSAKAAEDMRRRHRVIQEGSRAAAKEQETEEIKKWLRTIQARDRQGE